MTESSTSEACLTPRRTFAVASLYFAAASLFALDPVLLGVLFGFDPMPDAPHETAAAALAAIAGLFGALAVASDDVGAFAGDVP